MGGEGSSGGFSVSVIRRGLWVGARTAVEINKVSGVSKTITVGVMVGSPNFAMEVHESVDIRGLLMVGFSYSYSRFYQFKGIHKSAINLFLRFVASKGPLRRVSTSSPGSSLYPNKEDPGSKAWKNNSRRGSIPVYPVLWNSVRIFKTKKINRYVYYF